MPNSVMDRTDIVALVTFANAFDARSSHEETIIDIFDATLSRCVGDLRTRSRDVSLRIWLYAERGRCKLIQGLATDYRRR